MLSTIFAIYFAITFLAFFVSPSAGFCVIGLAMMILGYAWGAPDLRLLVAFVLVALPGLIAGALVWVLCGGDY